MNKNRLARNFKEQCPVYRWRHYRCQLVAGHDDKHLYSVPRIPLDKKTSGQSKTPEGGK
jgi:hypothetical protein